VPDFVRGWRTVLNYLFIETFSQGSHSLFVNGLSDNSSHHIDVISMAGENWRWRMLGSALHIAENIPPLDKYDGIIITDLFNLSDFKALVGTPCPPVLAYFHENQITYPQPPGDKGAFQLGIINITTALVADMVVFNSKMHRDSFLNAIPGFLRRGRDYGPEQVAEKIREKSTVLYPGITLEIENNIDIKQQTDPPLIVWNHRWGFDKNYEMYFKVLEELNKMELDFHLAIMGENFGMIPEQFKTAEKQYKDRILQFGYVPSRQEYEKWLRRGAIVISTAMQENFGMSVIEAIIMGCIPLLPDRLSYPEILPKEFHEHFLYKNIDDLIEKFFRITSDYKRYEETQNRLAQKMRSFLWGNVVEEYDRVLKRLAAL
jgi:glycosyltransferase involved in cell wall biosynthesis